MTRARVWIGVSLLLLASAVVMQGSGPAGAGAVVVHDAAEGYSFRNHVIPVLTKMGCNSGPCHGAAAGKNGFALTLRGYDPEADYDTLTRQAAGRRVNKLEPARSLMLLKPTETVPPMCGTVSVGLSSIRLRAGSSLLTRRPAACRVSVS